MLNQDSNGPSYTCTHAPASASAVTSAPALRVYRPSQKPCDDVHQGPSSSSRQEHEQKALSDHRKRMETASEAPSGDEEASPGAGDSASRGKHVAAVHNASDKVCLPFQHPWSRKVSGVMAKPFQAEVGDALESADGASVVYSATGENVSPTASVLEGEGLAAPLSMMVARPAFPVRSRALRSDEQAAVAPSLAQQNNSALDGNKAFPALRLGPGHPACSHLETAIDEYMPNLVRLGLCINELSVRACSGGPDSTRAPHPELAAIHTALRPLDPALDWYHHQARRFSLQFVADYPHPIPEVGRPLAVPPPPPATTDSKPSFGASLRKSSGSTSGNAHATAHGPCSYLDPREFEFLPGRFGFVERRPTTPCRCQRGRASLHRPFLLARDPVIKDVEYNPHCEFAGSSTDGPWASSRPRERAKRRYCDWDWNQLKPETPIRLVVPFLPEVGVEVKVDEDEECSPSQPYHCGHLKRRRSNIDNNRDPPNGRGRLPSAQNRSLSDFVGIPKTTLNANMHDLPLDDLHALAAGFKAVAESLLGLCKLLVPALPEKTEGAALGKWRPELLAAKVADWVERMIELLDQESLVLARIMGRRFRMDPEYPPARKAPKQIVEPKGSFSSTRTGESKSRKRFSLGSIFRSSSDSDTPPFPFSPKNSAKVPRQPPRRTRTVVRYLRTGSLILQTHILKRLTHLPPCRCQYVLRRTNVAHEGLAELDEEWRLLSLVAALQQQKEQEQREQREQQRQQRKDEQEMAEGRGRSKGKGKEMIPVQVGKRNRRIVERSWQEEHIARAGWRANNTAKKIIQWSGQKCASATNKKRAGDRIDLQ